MWTYDYKTVGFEALVEGVALPSEPWRKLDLPQLFFVYLRSNRPRPEFEVSVFKSNVWDFFLSAKREAYRFAVTWNMSCDDAQMWKYFMRTVCRSREFCGRATFLSILKNGSRHKHKYSRFFSYCYTVHIFSPLYGRFCVWTAVEGCRFITNRLFKKLVLRN